jgi:hypothetical protein
MRRALAATVAFALAVLLLSAAMDEREVAFEVGLPAVRPAAELAPGEEVCRDAIEAPAAFERVGLVVGTLGRPGPPLEVDVDEARGRVAGGYPDNATVEAAVGEVAAGGRERVCVRNAGAVPVVLFGSPPHAAPRELDDPDLRPEIAFVFLREPPDSMLSLVPDAFERSALFRPGGAWLDWALLVAMALVLPAALAAAYTSVRSSSRSDEGSSERAS